MKTPTVTAKDINAPTVTDAYYGITSRNKRGERSTAKKTNAMRVGDARDAVVMKNLSHASMIRREGAAWVEWSQSDDPHAILCRKGGMERGL